MFRVAIYINFFLLFVMSIVFLVKVLNDESDLKKIRRLVYVYILFMMLNGYFAGYTDLSWDVIRLIPFIIITLILNVVTIVKIRKKIKKSDNSDFKPMSIRMMLLLIIIPIIIVGAPFAREVYVLYNCDYMIVYNYQEAWIESTDTNIAVINNEPVTISLELYMFDREGIDVETENYDVTYNDSGAEISKGVLKSDKVIVNNKDIEKIALDALEMCTNAKSADVIYIAEGKYTIITLLDEVGHGTVLGGYFYYDNTCITSINPEGDLHSVISYR